MVKTNIISAVCGFIVGAVVGSCIEVRVYKEKNGEIFDLDNNVMDSYEEINRCLNLELSLTKDLLEKREKEYQECRDTCVKLSEELGMAKGKLEVYESEHGKENNYGKKKL